MPGGRIKLSPGCFYVWHAAKKAAEREKGDRAFGGAVPAGKVTPHLKWAPRPWLEVDWGEEDDLIRWSAGK